MTTKVIKAKGDCHLCGREGATYSDVQDNPVNGRPLEMCARCWRVNTGLTVKGEMTEAGLRRMAKAHRDTR